MNRKHKPTRRGMKQYRPPGWFDHRYLYLMIHNRQALVKIGISSAPFLRAEDISESMPGHVTPILWMRIYFAENHEELLHSIFRRYNRPVKGSGGTEFFTMFPTLLIAPFLITGIYLIQKFFIPAALTFLGIYLLANAQI